jgi:tetratricopeptide (TPR) repeat protein
LLLAVEEADERHLSPAKRLRLRLELADVQRKSAVGPAGLGADAHKDKAKLDLAERTARGAIEIAARASDSNGYVEGLDALAEIFLDKENYPALEKAAAEAMRLGAALPYPDPLRMARRAHCLGIARHQNGRSMEATAAMAKALTIYESAHGADHPETAKILSELGRVYRSQGQHEKAQDTLLRSLRIYKDQFGLESPEASNDLHELVGSFEDSGDVESAADLLEQVLLYKQRKLGNQNLDELAEMQFSVAKVHMGWGNVSRARELLGECIGTFRRLGGPRLAVAYETLAQLEESSGRYHSAIREMENAGNAWEKCKPARTLELARNLEYRADLLEQLRKKRESSWLRERAEGLWAEVAQSAAAAGRAR